VNASELVVGSERGLEIYGADGVLRRLVSPGPAFHPRWLDPGTIAVVVPVEQDTLSAGARLQKITLSDGTRSELGTLPPFRCSAKPNPERSWPVDPDMFSGLNLHDNDDFQVSQRQGLACLRLMDRNINMANVLVDVRFDLARHSVERWLSVGQEDCAPPADVHLGDAPSACEQLAPSAELAPDAPHGDYAFDIREQGEHVDETTPTGVTSVLRIAGYERSRLSPSGRWRLLQGDETEGDYLYYSVVLLDRVSGLVYPVVHPDGAWPAPLPTSGKSHQVHTPIEQTLQLIAEADVRWFGDATSEALVIDGSIVRPGVGTVALRGEVAQ
jgi:hypothetical protein